MNHSDETLAEQHQRLNQQQSQIKRLEQLLRKQNIPRDIKNEDVKSTASNRLASLGPNEKLEKVFRYVQQQENMNRVKKYSRKLSALPTKPFTAQKLVHLDLKGAAPRVSYLLKFMATAKEYGATGFLIEYEDMFPWSGNLSFAARKTAYSKQDITKILQTASRLEMEVIPLVQTYGHLEFLLKRNEYKHLRRRPEDVRSINPSKSETLPLVKHLIDQILQTHPEIKWLHIGGDEVYELTDCDGCHKLKMSDTQLYLHHMLPILKYVRSKQNRKGENIVPILWDDMFRKWDVDDMKEIAKYAVPMIWGYVPDLSHYTSFPSDMWAKYSESFTNVFFASAFKGASDDDTDLMEVALRAKNHLEWLKVASLLGDIGVKLEGVALTGWSRFSNSQPLCELLPVGTPSLALCLEILNTGAYNDSTIEKVSNMLGIDRLVGQTGILGNPEKYNSTTGHFLGSDVYKIVESVSKVTKQAFNILRHRYSKTTQDINKCRSFIPQLQEMKVKVLDIFPKYFYNDTVAEWVEKKIDNRITELNSVITEHEKRMAQMDKKHGVGNHNTGNYDNYNDEDDSDDWGDNTKENEGEEEHSYFPPQNNQGLTNGNTKTIGDEINTKTNQADMSNAHAVVPLQHLSTNPEDGHDAHLIKKKFHHPRHSQGNHAATAQNLVPARSGGGIMKNAHYRHHKHMIHRDSKQAWEPFRKQAKTIKLSKNPKQ